MELHYGMTDSKPWNWSRRQPSRQMSFTNSNHHPGEVEYAAAVAAAAFAVNTLESTTRTRDRPIMSRPDYRASQEYEESRRGHGARLADKIIRQVPSFKRAPTLSGSKRYAEDIRSKRPEIETQTSTYRSAEQPAESIQTARVHESEADQWERGELDKIRQRYDKLEMTIREWEERKRKKAERKLERTEGELGKRRARALQRYQSDIERIRQVAEGARAQSKHKRRKEELKVRERAHKLRTTGQLPSTCLCF